LKIIAFAEHSNGQFKKTAFEVVHAARKVADQLNAETVGLVIGNKVASFAAQLGDYGASKVIIVEDDRLEHYSTTAFAKSIAEVVRPESDAVVFFPSSAMGKDCAPRVAAKLDAGLASDCTAFRVENGVLVATRPVYAGKASVEVAVKSAIKIFSLRPNVFPTGDPNHSSVPVEKRPIIFEEKDFASVVHHTQSASQKKDVAEADIIVSGGRGLRGPENFSMIEELASVLGAAVGASRAVVDAGWRPHDEQVGQTGKTVAPSLYIAVAISGAVQHLAGMSSSKYIVAINKDKDAPIFSVADYGIVGDAFEIIPALIAELKKSRTT
jgi:electron transfer flavoprotein alpha subunit